MKNTRPTRRVKISVDKDHIKAGTLGSTQACPIALAVQSRTTWRCRVLAEEMYFDDFNPIHLPRSATKFIQKYDKGQRVCPFSFFITIPD